jgi:transposase-like protein
MNTSLSHIVSEIAKLPLEDQRKIQSELNNLLAGEVPGNSNVIEIRKKTFEKKDLMCPHCDSSEIIGFGNYKGGKRYRCKSCHRTFNDLTGTSISNLHKKESFVEYFKCLSNGLALRKSAEQVGISLQTSFDWRHKILNAFKEVGCVKLEGIMEGDETFFLYSEKGNKKIEGRNPRKRGGNAKSKGISNEQVAVLVAADRYDNMIIEPACIGRIKTKDIEEVLGKWIDKKSGVLCTDYHVSYQGFAMKKELKHVKLKGSIKQHVKENIYHIQNVNNIHSMMKKWMVKFDGVATKYLENYMNWYRITRKLGEGESMANEYLTFALLSNKSYTPAKMIKQHKFRT